ncbi:MAG: phosphate acyltransferase PlsX [Kiritimatiellia bacterium]|jgi:glycerol-3-phosphate acyltransferase PlsX
MRVAVDAMGGDHAPGEIVRGCMDAVQSLPGDIEIIMVGNQEVICQELADAGGKLAPRLGIFHCEQSIDMDEAPAVAVRRKKDASINWCNALVKRGEADASISAGNSGAMVASALFHVGRVKGVFRPAIAMVLPTRDPSRPLLLLDAGANTDCDERMLAQFAVMGSVYSEALLKRRNPVVGLLGIGTEEGKGNNLTHKAFSAIQKSNVNFCGNIEGHDLFTGGIDVAVTDGFVGNVVLKTAESVARALANWIKDEITANPLRKTGALILKGAFKSLKARMDPDMYGGAPLLGVDGTVIITHGSASRKTIFHTIRVTRDLVKSKMVQRIADHIAGRVVAE